VYFVSNNENKSLGAGVPGQPNVYVIHNGVTSLVATASENDTIRIASIGSTPEEAPWVADLGLRQAEEMCIRDRHSSLRMMWGW